MVDSVNKTNAICNPITIAGGVGALVGGVATTVAQKKILNHPDEFIREFEGEIRQEQKFCTESFKGTKEAAESAFKKLEAKLQKAKDFANGGKLNFKIIGKHALGIGAICAGVATVYCLLGKAVRKAVKHEVRDNAKIVAEEMNNAKSKEV